MSPAVGVPIGPVEGSRRRKPKRRQVPNGAKCRTARNAEEREKPKSAEPAERRRSPLLPPFRHPARRVAFRAVRHFALSAFGAVRLRAFRHLAPLRLAPFCRPPMPIGPKPTWAPCHGLSMVDPRA